MEFVNLKYILFITQLILLCSCVSTELTSTRLGHRSDDSRPPDFHSKIVNSVLASRLAGIRLATATRLRRDETEARKNVEAAEVDSAVAAIQAEEAKESALKAFRENEKIQNYIQGKDTPSTISTTAPDLTQSKTLTITSSPDDESDENGEDDDDEAVETVVEDGAVKVRTDFNDKGRQRSSQNKDTVSNASPPVPKTEAGVCQGLLDLKRMTDDFRERLQAIVEREERAVERLESLQQSKYTKSLNQIQKDVEPSRACVFIEENLNPGPEMHKSSRPESDKSTWRGSQSANTNGKIHVYTSQGVLPSPQPPTQNKGDSVPILEGRILPHSDVDKIHKKQQFSSNGNIQENFRSPSKTRRVKAVRSSDSQDDENEPEIELEKILWLKPSATDENGEENSDRLSANDAKYQSAVAKIMDEGYDILIIPISPRFTRAKDVATSLVDAMRGKQLRKTSKNRRFKMTVRRI